MIPAARGTLFTDRIPDATLKIYKGIGHLPMEEAADRTAQDISTFLARP